MTDNTIATLRYINSSAQSIYDAWIARPDSDNIPDDPDDFQECFQDGLEAASAGAPLTLFPILTDDTMTLIWNLIAARIYQLMMNPTITNDED